MSRSKAILTLHHSPEPLALKCGTPLLKNNETRVADCTAWFLPRQLPCTATSAAYQKGSPQRQRQAEVEVEVAMIA